MGILGRFKRIIKKAGQKPLPPPSEFESKLIQELRGSILQLSSSDQEMTNPGAESFWQESRGTFRSLLMNDDPRRFLTWDIVKFTMFVGNLPYIEEELNRLRDSKDWHSRWCKSIRETQVGLPEKYPTFPISSGNLIHHAFNLLQFEERTGQKVETFKLIVEFGGGYGSMCRLIHNLGYKGKYIIFDLPELSALQRFFLKSNNIEIFNDNSIDQFSSGVICISNIAELANLLKDQTVDLFIATWSISETPESFREKFLELVSDANNYLIGYQDCFGEVDNKQYFSKWSASKEDFNWSNWKIPHLQSDNLLIGSVNRIGS